MGLVVISSIVDWQCCLQGRDQGKGLWRYPGNGKSKKTFIHGAEGEGMVGSYL